MDPLINSTEITADPSSSKPESAAADSTVVLSGMSLDVFNAAKDGNLGALRGRGVRLEEELTATKSTVLHVYLACSSSRNLMQNNNDQVQKSTDIVEKILLMCSSLLLMQNESGDTALHIAARYGRVHEVNSLIKAAKDHPDHSDLEQGTKEESKDGCLNTMIRKTNKVKNTALHEAVRLNHCCVVKILTKEDRKFYYSTNDLGETPLYLAAERGYHHMVSEMLQNCTFPAFQGPRGRTALHAAVILGDKEMTQLLVKDHNFLIKAKDDQGFTPLHLAAYYDHDSIVQLLLKNDRSVAYVAKTDDKMTALHIAVSKGNIKSMEQLISQCPDCCEVVDYKGQNILHHAIMSRDYNTLKYLFSVEWLRNLLLNGLDTDGNSPIHVFADSPSVMIDDFLRNANLDILAFNKKSLNAFDIILANENNDVSLNVKDDFKMELRYRGVKQGHRIKSNKDNEKKVDNAYEISDEAKENHMLVATLIATVSFAAGIAMPGGYADEGYAVLTRNAAFKAFVIANTIAMAMSSCSVLVLLYSSLHKKPRNNKIEKISETFSIAVSLTMASLVLMMVAFITGTYAVLGGHSSRLARTACVLGCVFFFLFAYYLLSTESKLLKAPPILDDIVSGFNQLFLKALGSIFVNRVRACSYYMESRMEMLTAEATELACKECRMKNEKKA